MSDNADKNASNTPWTNQETSRLKQLSDTRRKLLGFTTGNQKEGPKRESFLENSDVDLLDWVKGERTIFWAWVYVNCATCDNLEIDYPGLEPHDKPYKEFALNGNPVSSEERLSFVHCWFREIEKRINFSSAYKIMLIMRTEWLHIQNNIKSVDWIRKTDVHTRWLWDRLKKDELFTGSFLFWFNPANAKERLLAINAAIDFFMPDQILDVTKFTRLKNEFVKRQKRNYTALTSPKARETCQVSVNLSPDTKTMLDTLVKSGGKNQSATIEWLIRDRWATGNQGQNGNEQKEVNARSGED